MGKLNELNRRQLAAIATTAEKHLTALRQYGREYTEVLEAINDLIAGSKRQVECCLCGRMIYDRMSCNPDPVDLNGRCCRMCDIEIVIPARARHYYEQRSERV